MQCALLGVEEKRGVCHECTLPEHHNHQRFGPLRIVYHFAHNTGWGGGCHHILAMVAALPGRNKEPRAVLSHTMQHCLLCITPEQFKDL